MAKLAPNSQRSKRERKETYRMRQYPGQMGKIALIQGQHALCSHRPGQTIKRTRVQIARLIIHARHDRIRGVHNTANDEATRGTTRHMQRHTLLHAEMLDEPPLCEKVRGQLDRAAEPRSYHCGSHAPIQSLYALGRVDLTHAVERVAVVVLGADGEEGRVRLQPRFHEEEGGSGCGAEDPRRGACEKVYREGLYSGVVVEGCGESFADGLVEAQAAAVQGHLVNVLFLKY